MLDAMRRGVSKPVREVPAWAPDRRLRRLGHRRRRASTARARWPPSARPRSGRRIPAGLPGRDAVRVAPARPPPHARAGEALGLEPRACAPDRLRRHRHARARARASASRSRCVAKVIRDDPAFARATASSLTKFSEVIGRTATERGSVHPGRRRDILREQLTETLGDGVAPQPSLIDTLHRFREETRVIEYVTPDFDKLVTIAEPDEAKLREFYEQNKRQYIALEQRKANLLLLTRDEASRADRSPTRRSRPPTRRQRDLQRPREAPHPAADVPRQGGCREGLRGAGQGQEFRRGGRQARLPGHRHRPRRC